MTRWHTANCPCPPDCLTCRPCASARPVAVSFMATRTGTCSTPTLNRVRNRLSTRSRWAGPVVHSTTCPVAASCSMRSDGSSAASSRNATGIRSSSARVAAATAAGSSASGRAQGVTSSGASGEERVSDVCAVESLVTTTTSPAIASVLGSSSPSKGAAIAPGRTSSSWAAWPSPVGTPSSSRWPDTCTARSARRVPENTRTSERCPT